MINILFVDDEPNILEGLERMLRYLRHEWQMSFAKSGAEALAVLNESPFDVVVSDMKMPGMDGSELLQTISERHPHIVRIILSGFSDQEANMKSLGTAHQYLSKPCDPELLKSIISNVSASRDTFTNEPLRRLVGKLPTVPSLPVLYSQLVEELGTEGASTKKVAQIIRKDIGMTVKILQVVNSAFFGRRRYITDVRSAVDLLGLDAISSLVLGIGIIAQFERHLSGLFFSALWCHSLAVGVTADRIAVGVDRDVKNEAFTAGLLHDIGKVVLAINLPEEYRAVDEQVKRTGVTTGEAEVNIFGASHADVGGYLLSLWGLPNPVINAVAFHHTPLKTQSSRFTALTAVHAADAIHSHIVTHGDKTVEASIDREYLDSIGMLEKFSVWQEEYSLTLVEDAKT